MPDPARLYEPPDIMEAYGTWKCNCGPAALAAILRRPAMSVRELFPLFASRPWVNPTHMKEAVRRAGATWKLYQGDGFPRCGLVFVQITGPWEAPGVPIGAAYCRTHWIATYRGWDSGLLTPGGQVYDINAAGAGGWRSREYWESRIMPLIVQAHKRATGWRVRSAMEVIHA